MPMLDERASSRFTDLPSINKLVHLRRASRTAVAPRRVARSPRVAVRAADCLQKSVRRIREYIDGHIGQTHPRKAAGEARESVGLLLCQSIQALHERHPARVSNSPARGTHYELVVQY